MEVSLYPGCSLQGLAKSYIESLEAVSKTLGVELRELEDWTCCGASSAHVTNDRLAVSLSARNLGIADQAGMDLVVPCSACFHRLKVAEKHLKQGKPADGLKKQYKGNFTIKALPDFFWDNIGEKALKEKVKKPLDALSPVCYYGCLTLRPPDITDAKNPEDPQEMDKVLQGLGANVKNWSFKADCCGGNLTLTRPDLHMNLTQRILDMSQEAGADCIAVACPMCHENLDSKQAEISAESGKPYNIPIFYFPELIGVAYGDPAAGKWMDRHIVNPRPLLRNEDLL